MKTKNLFLMVVIAVSTMMIAACTVDNNDNPVDNPGSEPITGSFSADAVPIDQLSSEHIGWIICSGGVAVPHIAPLSFFDDGNPVAMVSYAKRENNKTQVLAISTEELGYTNWDNAKKICEDMNITHPVPGATWRFPSMADYEYIVTGECHNRNDHTLIPDFFKMNRSSICMTPLTDYYYWTSNVDERDLAAVFCIYNIKDSSTGKIVNQEANFFYQWRMKRYDGIVRAVLAINM
jgi:hypothetical protein